MKKELLILLCLFLQLTAKADSVEINGVWYNLFQKSQTAEVTNRPSGELYEGEITIPATVSYDNTEYNVTSIGEIAFQGCENLTSVIIPNSVTTILTNAFYRCTSLKQIEIPNSVTSIGSHAFSYSGLKSLNIPNSVTSLGYDVFDECKELESLVVGSGLQEISGFSGCISLTSITLSEGLDRIGNYAFNRCESLKNIIIPNSVTAISWNAFNNCKKLTTVFIGNGLYNIGENAFANCKDLSDFYISSEKGVTAAKSNTFENSDIEYATLHVLEQYISDYQSQEPWSKFKQIVSWNGTLKIHSVFTDNNMNIYDLNGNRLNNTRKGLNIIKNNNGIKKVITK